VELTLPPLRERPDDIAALCEHFLRQFAEQKGLPKRHLTRAALARLMQEPWPGNVRQLEHVLLQASVMTDTSTIDVGTLGLDPASASSMPPAASPVFDASARMPRVESLGDHKLDEKQRILDALQACGWNRVKAAETLGMPRRTFYRRLADYAILS
jgi:serine/threonine-protein kinase PknK